MADTLDRITVGCHTGSLDDILSRADALGEVNGYTPEEIARYKSILQWIKENDPASEALVGVTGGEGEG